MIHGRSFACKLSLSQKEMLLSAAPQMVCFLATCSSAELDVIILSGKTFKLFQAFTDL